MQPTNKLFGRCLPLLLLCLFVLSFCFCRRGVKVNVDLLHIDSLIQCNPDSAYIRLEEYDKSKLAGSSDSALFDLLWTEARYKTYHDDTSSSALKPAEKYFRNTRDSYNLMRVLYYKGLACYNKGANGEALVCFDEALENADTCQNFYRGKIYTAMADVAGNIRDWHLELIFRKEALKFFSQTDSFPFIQYAKLTLGNILIANQNADKGMAYLHEVRDNAIVRGDSILLKRALGCLGNAYLWENDYFLSKSFYGMLYRMDEGKSMKIKDKNLFLWAMDNSDITSDSIDRVCQEIKEEEGPESVIYEYFEKREDYKAAFFSLKKEHKAQTRDYSSTAVSDAHFMLHNIEQEKLKNSIAEIKLMRYRNISIVIAAAFLMTVVGTAVSIILRKKKSEIRELVSTVGILRQSIMDLEQSSSGIASPLLANLLTHLGSLYGEYYKLPEDNQKGKGIASSIRKGMEELQNDSSFLDGLENDINAASGNLLKEVYGKMKKLTQQQRRLVAFLYYGFSNDSLCALFNIRPDAFYNRKTRLKKILESSESDRKEELMTKLFGKNKK